jgi:hypothetical protein
MRAIVAESATTKRTVVSSTGSPQLLIARPARRRLSRQSLEPVGEQPGAMSVLMERHVTLAEDPEQSIVEPTDGAGRVPVVHSSVDGGLVGGVQHITKLGE